MNNELYYNTFWVNIYVQGFRNDFFCLFRKYLFINRGTVVEKSIDKLLWDYIAIKGLLVHANVKCTLIKYLDAEFMSFRYSIENNLLALNVQITIGECIDFDGFHDLKDQGWKICKKNILYKYCKPNIFNALHKVILVSKCFEINLVSKT